METTTAGMSSVVTAAVPTTCRFGPVDVEYDDRVLVPRPWTLLQSEWAAELALALPSGSLLELCAGAGHIGLAAAVRAGRDLVQVEADPIAAGYAAANAARAGWGTRTELRVARLEVAVCSDELFPLIVADPPYLRTEEIRRWPDDPVTAIDGGADGLDLVDACLDVAARHLLPDGVLLLQVAGARQAKAVRPRASSHGLWTTEVRSVDAERAVMALERLL